MPSATSTSSRRALFPRSNMIMKKIIRSDYKRFEIFGQSCCHSQLWKWMPQSKLSFNSVSTIRFPSQVHNACGLSITLWNRNLNCRCDVSMLVDLWATLPVDALTSGSLSSIPKSWQLNRKRWFKFSNMTFKFVSFSVLSKLLVYLV